MKVLGIETSCDETGIAVYDTDRGLLADGLYSQVAVHAEYGGVVPELASRDHIRKTLPLINQVLAEAGMAKGALDAVDHVGQALHDGLVRAAQAHGVAREQAGVLGHHLERLLRTHHVVEHLGLEWGFGFALGTG